MSKESTCATCGFTWKTGKSGEHSCSQELLITLRLLQETAAARLQLLRDLRAELDGGSFFLASSGPERERGLRLLDRLKESLS